MRGRRFVVAAMAGIMLASVACASSSDDGTASEGSEFNAAGHGSGVCELWHQQRESVFLASAQPCGPIGPTPTVVGRELAILWGTAPTSTCGYVSGAGGCGPLGPNNAFYCPIDDSISWHVPWMIEKLSPVSNFGPVVILAHEWGHLNQKRTGLSNPQRLTIQNELHADCQAGIFTAVQELQGHLEPGDAQTAFKTFCELGDRAGTPWFDSTAHGSCAQRTASFLHGYQQAKALQNVICGPGAVAAMLQICAN